MSKRSRSVEQWPVGGRVSVKGELSVVGTIVAKPAGARGDSSRVSVQLVGRGVESWMKTKLVRMDEDEYERSLSNSVHAYAELTSVASSLTAGLQTVIPQDTAAEVEEWPSCEPCNGTEEYGE